MNAETQKRLREEFPAAQVGRLPKAGVELDYVGHGAVTGRLLEVDPTWFWEPVAFDESGLPLLDRDTKGAPVGLWIKLTVSGVTRFGYGSCKAGQFDAEKVLIGDAIRNAAMRFGVALDLWIRGHAEDDEQVSAQDSRQRPERGQGSRRQGGAPECAACGKSLAGSAVKVVGGEKYHQGCTDEYAQAHEVPEGEEPF